MLKLSCFVSPDSSFSSDRQHLSYDVCLEVRGGEYQNCSVLYCVLKLCTVISTLRSAVSSYSSLDWVLSHWVYFTVHRFVCVHVFVFCFRFVLYSCCIIVTRWGGLDGIRLKPSFSALTLLVGSFDR